MHSRQEVEKALRAEGWSLGPGTHATVFPTAWASVRRGSDLEGTLHAAVDSDGVPWLLFFSYTGPKLLIDQRTVTRVQRAARGLNRVDRKSVV